MSLFSNKWMTSPTYWAQSLHVFSAYAIVLTAAYLWTRLAGVIAAILVIGAGAFKEFYYDAKYETPAQTTWDNVLDFITYAAGAILALLVIFFFKHS